MLHGNEVVTWRNTTDHATSELRLHLYFNAWRNESSSFLRAAQRGSRPISPAAIEQDDWAFIEVESVRLVEPSPAGAEAPPSETVPLETRYIHPDDGNEQDRTVLQVLLPEPVPPGGSAQVRIPWRLKIPRALTRVGFEGDYFLLGHWFPKLGVFEADGEWNCHQFIQTEFYADFGVYDVELTMPAGWVVGATGTLLSRAQNADGTETRRFRAEDVQDFAFAASPHFEVHTERFEHPDLPPIDLELLLLPDHRRLRDRYFESAEASLELFGEWFGPYPWDRLTIVDPPSGTNTGGMEYPMFLTAESRWISLPRNRLTEANVAHEIAHMWWFGAVANNEFEDAWLDEALATYSHRRLLDEVYYPNRFEKRYFHGFLPLAFPSVERAQPTHGADSYDGFRSRLKLERLDTPSYLVDERTYFLMPYVKGSLMLVTLERHLGWETWQKVLRTYAERFWFAHPQPEDFFRVVSEVSGQDFTWYFDQAYRSAALFDYAVDRVLSRPSREPRGYVERNGEPDWQPGGPTDTVDSIIDVRRWGDGRFPVSVRVTFDDGSVVTERWDGRALRHRLHYRRASGVHTVEVDPERVLVLDTNRGNNSWTREPMARDAALKWAAKWLIWLQSVMELAAGLS